MPARALLLQLNLDPSVVNITMIGLMAAIFWLFIIRPQARRQKEQTAFQDAVSKGDRVVTNAGILGRVSKIDKEGGVVTLEVSKNTYLEVTSGSLSRELTEAKYGETKA